MLALPLTPVTGATVYTLTPDQPLSIQTPSNTDLGASLGDVVYTGLGRLVKSGAGAAVWGARSATFALQAGSWIDVLEGRFIGGSGVNEDWTRNQSGLNVAAGAIFEGQEANVRVDALSGSGLIRSGYSDGQSRYGYETFTFGVANGSGSFAGVLADGNSPAHFTKAGSGTQVLTGSNTYTGGTRVAGGILAIGDGGTRGAILGPVQVDAGATLAFNRADDIVFNGTVNGEGRLLKTGSGTLVLTQALNLREGLEIQKGARGVSLAAGSSFQGPLRNDSWLQIEAGAQIALRDGISGSGTLIHQGSLLTLSGEMSSSLELVGQESGQLSRLIVGEAGRATTLRSGSITVGGWDNPIVVDIAGPQTQVLLAQDPYASTPQLIGILGISGASALTVRDGAQLKRSHVDVSYGGTLRVLGPASQVEVFGQNQGLIALTYGATLQVGQGAQLQASQLLLDARMGPLTFSVDGAGSRVEVAELFSLGPNRISVLAGGTLETGKRSSAGTPGTQVQGLVTISGPGSRWLLADKVRAQQLQLTLTDGGLLRAESFQTGPATQLLLDGGTLELSAAPQGSFMAGLDWRRGTLSLNGDACLDQGLLAASLNLDAGRQLQVNGQLSINNGQSLQIGAAGSLSAQALRLDGGTLDLHRNADFKTALDWQQGRLVLSGDWQPGQGLLASLPALDAQHRLGIAGTLSQSAGAAPLLIGSTGVIDVSGGLRLDGPVRIEDGGQLLLNEGSQSQLRGSLQSLGDLRLSGAVLELSGAARVRALDLQSTAAGPAQLLLGQLDGSSVISVDTLNLGNNSELLARGRGTEVSLGQVLSSPSLYNSRITVRDGATLRVDSEFAMQGSDAQAGRNQLLVSGMGSSFDSNFQFYDRSLVQVEAGGAFKAIGTFLNQDAILRARGAGTSVTSSLVMLNANGRVEVLDGAQVKIGSLDPSRNSSLLLDGGELTLASPRGSFMAGLDWRQGRLNLGGEATLNQALLAPTLTLDSAHQLVAFGQLGVLEGQHLTVASADALKAKTLLLQGGSLSLSAQLKPSDDFRWERGALNLAGDAQQSQGLLSQVSALGAGMTLQVQGDLTLDGHLPLQLNGGRLEAQALQLSAGAAGLDWRSGSVQLHGDAALGQAGLPAHLRLDAAKQLAVDGRLLLAQGSDLRLEDGTLSFAELALQGGRLEIDAQQNLGGRFNWQSGTLALRGDAGLEHHGIGGRTTLAAGQHLALSGTLQLGKSVLTLNEGGSLTARRIDTAAGGRLLLEGGVLSVDRLDASLAAHLNWNRGTLAITGAAGASLGQDGLKKLTVLSEGQQLAVTQQLNLGRGTQLLVDGGQLAARTLALQGGTLASSDLPLNLSAVQTLEGHGLVNARIQGGAQTTLRASGGTLTLGDADQIGSFTHAGALSIAGGATALLLSADAARLDGRVQLEAGARLSSLNGLVLGQTAELHASGDAVVQGDLQNEGHVLAEAGTLSFLGDVSGSGSFAGQLLFKAGYQPGQGLASVDFGGGRLSFGKDSVLTLDLDGSGQSNASDQLLHIGQLDFHGTLRLQFGAQFQLHAGDRFTLLDFQSFSGSLSPERIIVSGLDAAQLDLSQLATSGQIQVSAVPEAATSIQLLLGLGLLGGLVGGARRRKQAAA
ncbi:autotransporter-associated beta strand repeat-containing protein [Paucibacter sp. APW11]|uniref:Autotransporter-associated beta strand repeat-containing protein n=1 Tax=Roseateles aquae TaxID=3077235 RepID=A0ABU3PD17_9BURK|nr:autotransporter-associated beta strand repeat-containing protein [Paucibacter sp. APW11]MDT8999761.1 autotransporter-associated beta strand repeat-containing protein [Paucibacter sp. APW11]